MLKSLPDSAILTILQINSAAANPLTRYSALLSLVCAFMSLLYGCIYIIRFGSMRKTHKAAEWANVSLIPHFSSLHFLTLLRRVGIREIEKFDLLERMGDACDACGLARLVRRSSYIASSALKPDSTYTHPGP